METKKLDEKIEKLEAQVRELKAQKEAQKEKAEILRLKQVEANSKKILQRKTELKEKAREIIKKIDDAWEELFELYSNSKECVPTVPFDASPSYGSGNCRYVYDEKYIEDEAEQNNMSLDEFKSILGKFGLWVENDPYNQGGGWRSSSDDC